MATFPLAVKRFVSRKDNVDSVRAVHMNEAQAEIEAIEDVLGVNPHLDDTTIDSTWRWSTVKARLEFMIRGRHIPAFTLYNGTTYTRATDTYSTATFAAPGAIDDTHHGFTANTYKVPRDGWYFFYGQVYFNSTTLKGSRQLRLYTQTGNIAFSNREYYGQTRAVGDWVQVVFLGRLNKGTTVGLSTNIQTGGYPNGKYTYTYASFRGNLVRGI